MPSLPSRQNSISKLYNTLTYHTPNQQQNSQKLKTSTNHINTQKQNKAKPSLRFGFGWIVPANRLPPKSQFYESKNSTNSTTKQPKAENKHEPCQTKNSTNPKQQKKRTNILKTTNLTIQTNNANRRHGKTENSETSPTNKHEPCQTKNSTNPKQQRPASKDAKNNSQRLKQAWKPYKQS